MEHATDSQYGAFRILDASSTTGGESWMSTVDPPDQRLLTARAAIDGWLPILAVLCLVLVAAGGWLTYGAYVDPGTETQEQTLGTVEYQGTFEYGATVQESNAVYPTGTTLRDQPAYFTQISPILSGEYAVEYTARGTDTAVADVEVTRVIQSVSEGDGGETVIWSDKQRLGFDTATGGSGTATVPFSTTVPELNARVNSIEESLGGSAGTTEVLIQAAVTVEGVADGQQTTATTTQELTIEPSEATYSVSAPQSETQTAAITTTQTVERTPGLAEKAGGPLVILLGLVSLGVVGLVHQRGELSLTDAEETWREYQSDRDEFEEWITEMTLPERARELPEGTAESLGDLVDFAIDTDAAVIEDPTDGNYYVIHDETRYEYVPPEPPVSPSLRDVLGIDHEPPEAEPEAAPSADGGEPVADDAPGAIAEDTAPDSFEWSDPEEETSNKEGSGQS